jgi:hypothetical protein
MKKLYDAITESLFDEEEQLDNIDMSVWLSKQEWPYVVGNVKNSKIELDQLRIKDVDTPNIPEWVKFGNVKDLQLYFEKDNYDCSKLPEMNNVDCCFINPDTFMGQKVKVDAGGLKANNIRLLYVNLRSVDCVSLPKCPIDALFIGHLYGYCAQEYRNTTAFNADILKGMKFKKLIIGDSLITSDPYLFEKFHSSRTVYKDDPEYNRIKAFYDITKNLYIKHDNSSGAKHHKVSQSKDGFIISKTGFMLK